MTKSKRIQVVSGTALYLRNMHGPETSIAHVEREAAAFAKRAKAMGCSWMAIGAVWQDPDPKKPGAILTKFLNSPAECRIWAKALADVGIRAFVWGYPWLGAEEKFCNGMAECAGDDGLHLLDPELGANPERSSKIVPMGKARGSARLIVRGLRARKAKVVGLSTFGGIPPGAMPNVDDDGKNIVIY